MSQDPPVDDVSTLRTHRLLTEITVATASFLVYDTLLTMKDEIECFWMEGSRWNFVKVLFLLIRYIGILVVCLSLAIEFFVTTFVVCDKWFIIIGIGIWIVPVFSDLVMMLRVYTLYGRSRNVLISLSIFIAAMSATSVLLFIFGNNAPETRTGLSRGCFASVFPKLSNAALVPNLVNALVLFCLTAYKIHQIANRRNGGRGGPRYAPLLRVLLEHSIIYLLAMWTVILTAIVVLYFVKNPLANIVFSPSITSLTWLSSRLLLHLKRGVLLNPTPHNTRSGRSHTATSGPSSNPTPADYSAGAIITTIMTGPWNIEDDMTVPTIGGHEQDVELAFIGEIPNIQAIGTTN